MSNHPTPEGDFVVLCCLDGYEPELAPAVLGVVDAYDTETVRIIVEVMAWIAREETVLN